MNPIQLYVSAPHTRIDAPDCWLYILYDGDRKCAWYMDDHTKMIFPDIVFKVDLKKAMKVMHEARHPLLKVE